MKNFSMAGCLALSATLAFLLLLPATPIKAQSNQACSQLSGCNTAMYGTLGGYPIWQVTGAGCGAGCMLGNTMAFTCLIGGTSLAVAQLMGSDNTMNFCDFDCGTRGSCTIRGGDGLPVELIEFDVE